MTTVMALRVLLIYYKTTGTAGHVNHMSGGVGGVGREPYSLPDFENMVST